MQTDEQTNGRQNNGERREGSSCCGAPRQWQMPDCCRSMWQSDGGRAMMGRCMRMCRWFPVFPVIVGIGLLLFGYYLHAEISRVLWMVAGGSLVLMGIFCLFMMGRVTNRR